MIKSKPSLLQQYFFNAEKKPKYFFLEDVALIKLREPYHFDHKINSICLPLKPKFIKPIDESWYGKRFQFAGWGNLNATKKLSYILQHVSMGIMNSEGCFRNYIETVPLPKNWKDVKQKGFCADTSPNAGIVG